jgi:hypothetical protein
MSILDGLRNESGRQLSVSALVSRRRLNRRLKDRLPADRIAAALGTLPASSPKVASSRSTVWVPKPTLGASSLLRERLRLSASDGPAPVLPQPFVSRPAPSETGRHRGEDEPLDGWVPKPRAAAGPPPRHVRTPKHAIGDPAHAGSADRRPRGVSPLNDAPASGRHRSPARPKRAILSAPAALFGVVADSRRFLVVGVVALVVAVALMFGAHLASARSSGQPQTQLVATTVQSQAGGPARESGAVLNDSRTQPRPSAR